MSTQNKFDDPFTNITIPRYFEGKSVFLTGGTGFIGKVLVEKLLRGCPGLKNIYFLIRPKKGLSCEERLEKMFQVPVSFLCFFLIHFSQFYISIPPENIRKH